MTITADITMESNWNTQWQLESTQDTTYVPHAHTHGQNSTNHCLLSSNTSYTGIGASRIERFVGPEVAQRRYPQEAAIGVTPAMTDLLTTPQSGGQVPRIGHGSSTEQPQELPASQRAHADADNMKLNKITAQTACSARKRKECPTATKQCHNRSRHTESTQTTSEVQASWETYSQCTIVNQPHRPVMTSGWIQHQGQPRDRTLMARERGSTGYSTDVLEAGKMAASLRQVQTTASTMTTLRRVKTKKGEDGPQRLQLKPGGSGGIGGIG